jgi:prepilin-type N-terminal cleavage/methylation domain-containing protein
MQKVQAQQGFTLIELVVVIVLLGILGVSALAQFQDLSGDAQNAANAGVAAELTSGSSINYAARSLNASSGTPTALLLLPKKLLFSRLKILLTVPFWWYLQTIRSMESWID